jgi:hypothetical protein
MTKGTHGNVTAITHDWAPRPQTKAALRPLRLALDGPERPPERWAQLVFSAITSTEPLTNFEDWSAIVRLSSRTLRNRCHAAGVRGKHSLDFVRLLRIVVRGQHEGRTESFIYDLEDVDPRTLARLVRASGADGAVMPDLRTFLCRQTLITTPAAVQAIASMLVEMSAAG